MRGCPARPVRTLTIAELLDAVGLVAPVMPRRLPVAPYSCANASRLTAPRDDRPTRHAVRMLRMRAALTGAVESAVGDRTFFYTDDQACIRCESSMELYPKANKYGELQIIDKLMN